VVNNVLPLFQVVYADPPWPYSNPQSDDPARGGKPYREMTMSQLTSMSDLLDRWCAPDCALFLWGTWPKLREAIDLIDAWGFKYTTVAFVWVKLNKVNGGVYSGMGYWTNGNTEYCLFAKRGRPQRLTKDVKQVIIEPEIVAEARGEHSAKPACVRDRIVALMGDVPRVELFARERVPGWYAWGDQITP
jgi:N6-adenosine-specific RNA methylase IME4